MRAVDQPGQRPRKCWSWAPRMFDRIRPAKGNDGCDRPAGKTSGTSLINLIEFLHESDEADTLAFDDLEAAPAEMEDDYPEVQDPLLEINVGTEPEP
ncbi:unnamed protein product [Prunus armeniaca]